MPLMDMPPPPDTYAGFGLFDMDHDNYIVPAANNTVNVNLNMNVNMNVNGNVNPAEKLEYTLPQEQDLRLLMSGELC